MAGTNHPMRIRPVQADTHITECRSRLPFRFGMNTMTAAPLVTCRVEVECDSGGRASGYSSDLLVPKWFEKDANAPVSEDWARLLASQWAAIDTLLDGGGSASVFEHWRRVYADRVGALPRDATDLLVRGEGVSLVERAMIDAVCRRAGVGLREAFTGGMLGFEAETLDASVKGWIPDRLPSESRGVALRHTVGLVDAIEPDDIAPGDRVGDGLPECLVEDIRRFGLTHFKIKITSDSDGQVDRLARVWGVISREAGPTARVTLDGNEQFDSIAQFVGLLSRAREDRRFVGFFDALLLVEQPLARSRTFDREANAGMETLCAFAPCIIDEADAGAWAFPEARSLGYRGVSIKNCKGIFRAVLNRARCDCWGGGFVQSGEDLTNLPILALQQDLETMATLGVSHIERNGHHYFRGLDHLAEVEQTAALEAHPDLYAGSVGDAQLRIEAGQLALGSVLDAPGFGYAGLVDFGSRIPARSWDPTSLE
jgi:hypothetical protein